MPDPAPLPLLTSPTKPAPIMPPSRQPSNSATEPFGVIAARGTSQVAPLLAAVAADANLPLAVREMLALLGEEIEHLDGRLKELEAKLLTMHRANAVSQLLATIPGIGPIIAR